MPILQLIHILARVNQNSSPGGYVIAYVDAYICNLHLRIFLQVRRRGIYANSANDSYSGQNQPE